MDLGLEALGTGLIFVLKCASQIIWFSHTFFSTFFLIISAFKKYWVPEKMILQPVSKRNFHLVGYLKSSRIY